MKHEYCIYEVEHKEEILEFTDKRPSKSNEKCKGMVIVGNTKTMLQNALKILYSIKLKNK